MGTGDLKNLGTKLQVLFRTTKYPHVVNYTFLFYGYPQEFLPLLHYIFQNYSMHCTKFLLNKGYEMSGKSDKEFVDTVYKVLRDEFNYIPKLHKDKFFSNGFTEQKLLMMINIYTHFIEKNKSLTKKKTKPKKLVSKNQEKENVNKENIPIQGGEYSPIRAVPRPYTDKNMLAPTSDKLWDDSIIMIDETPPACTLGDGQYKSASAESHVKIYSEEGAREVYALDHLVAQEEVLDSTPRNVITDVQVIPIVQDVDNVDVKVTRQLSFDDENTNMQTNTHKTPPTDLLEIKQLLISLSARMDIMESKVKRLEDNRTVPAEFQNSIANLKPSKKAVSFSEDIEQSRDAEYNSCIAMSRELTSEPVQPDLEEEEDIMNFLKSAQERLSDTRTFLSSYDTL